MVSFTLEGSWWSDKDIQLVRLPSGRLFALSGWNGESYADSWECVDRYTALDDQKYSIRPIKQGVGEPNFDDEYGQYKTVGYEVTAC